MSSGTGRVMGSVLAIAILITAVPLFANGASDGQGTSKLPKTSQPLVVSAITGDQGVFTFRAREFTEKESLNQGKAFEGLKDIHPLINIDIHGVDEQGTPFVFSQDGYKAHGKTLPYVLVVLPAAFIVDQIAKLGGSGTTKYSDVTQILYYEPKTRKWISIAENRGDFLDWGRTADYFWFLVGGWPLNDRFIGCE